MKVKPRLIQKQNQACFLFLLQLGEVGQEGEEPHEALGALVEWHGYAMPIVPYAHVEDGSRIERRRVVGIGGGKVELDS